jgi:hypothetical protein
MIVGRRQEEKRGRGEKEKRRPSRLLLFSSSPFLLFCLVLGCRQAEPTPSAGIDEAAVQKYQALLEKDIDAIEELAAILKTVDSSAASKENAKLRLAELAATARKIQAEILAYPVKDLRVQQDIKNAAVYRVSQRKQVALTKLQEEIRRINQLDGGPEFFDKDVRQVMDAMPK